MKPIKESIIQMKIDEDGNFNPNKRFLRLDVSYETEIHNIYDPKFDSEIDESNNSNDVSRISIDNEDKMNAKMDPLFDGQSIEEIKIYSDYSNWLENDGEWMDTNLQSSLSPKFNISYPINCESPQIKLDSKFKRIEEGQSIDNTNQNWSTIPSFNFSFKNKNSKMDWTSFLQNSKRQEQNSKEFIRYKNDQFIFDSAVLKIPEEGNDHFYLNSSTPSQSRNLNYFENKETDKNITYTKHIHSKHPLIGKWKFDPDAISEYSAGTPSWLSARQEKIAKSLKIWKESIESTKQLKESTNDFKNQKFLTKTSSEKFIFKLRNTVSGYVSSYKNNYKSLAHKKKIESSKNVVHKYNKSDTTNNNESSKLSRALRKSKANYSIYLNHYHYSNSKSINPQFAENSAPFSKAISNINYSPTYETPKISDNSISSMMNKELITNMSNRYIRSDGNEQNYISLTSPGCLDSNISNESNVYRTKPKVSNYNIHSFRNDFYKTHTKNVSKNRVLEKKRKELEQKAKLLKEASIHDRYSRGAQTSVSSETTKFLKYNSFMYQKGSTSKGVYTSKNSIYKNYWKKQNCKVFSS